MKNTIGTLAGSIALITLCFGTVVEAKTKAEGWSNWADKAEQIGAAVQTQQEARVKSACNGVTGVVIGQGFQFPYWGQQLIGFCITMENNFHDRTLRRGDVKRICKNIRGLSKDLSKAQPVAEEPRAAPAALYLANFANLYYEKNCHL